MRDTRRTRIVLAVLLLTAFTFITLDARSGEGSIVDRLRDGAGTVLGPVERAAAAVVNPVSEFIDGVTSIGSNADRIAELEAENDELRRQILTSDLDQAALEEYRKILGVAALGDFEIVPAQVIAVASEAGYARTVTVDAGSRDGIAREQTVLDGDGLVGRVIRVTRGTATILLLSDPEFAVGARLAESRETGLAQGNGREPLSLELYNPQAAVDEGNVVVTLGSPGGRPFVPGIPIGEVTEVIATPGALSRQAVVEPFAQLTSLDLVGIIIEPPRRDPRDALVQPPPSPSPSPTTSSPGAATPSPSPSPTP